ncbi:MAG: hypothetical protein ACK4V1_07975, partial [Burkholderiaceae bacterium]
RAGVGASTTTAGGFTAQTSTSVMIGARPLVGGGTVSLSDTAPLPPTGRAMSATGVSVPASAAPSCSSLDKAVAIVAEVDDSVDARASSDCAGMVHVGHDIVAD